MIDLYTWTTPNGRKASIMLEEAGLPYAVHPIDIGKDAQFDPAFLKVSPNNKIPAIVDQDADGGPISVFESGAILVYLAEKADSPLLPKRLPARAKTLEWLSWQMGGVGPMFGQFGHFVLFARERVPYAIERYTNESLRLLRVLETQLERTEYLAGDYSIADIAAYPWVAAVIDKIAQTAADAPELNRTRQWLGAVAARPAVQRGMAIPSTAD